VTTIQHLIYRRARAIVPGLLLLYSWAEIGCNADSPLATLSMPVEFQQLAATHCSDCHAGKAAAAAINLADWSALPAAENFAEWRRVRYALAEHAMPPPDGPSLSDLHRAQMLDLLDATLRTVLTAHADDPGPTVVRRVTSAEYDYCIEDLTGLQLQLGSQFVSDSVGGSGFTNSAVAQFMQDATLERYLEAARRVADHAMLGTGRLYFYEAPGETGLELSAAKRIQEIYRRYGFRSAAGEGAEPFGMERFATAFQVAWQFRYRTELGTPEVSLQELAHRARLEIKFAEHIWQVLGAPTPSFPLSDIIDRFNQFPTPNQLPSTQPPAQEEPLVDLPSLHPRIVQLSQDLYKQVQTWQSRFAGSASAEEEAAVLAGGQVEIAAQAQFVARAARQRILASREFTPDLNNARLYSQDGRIRFKLSVEAASIEQSRLPVVIFSNPRFRFRVADLVQPEPLPLQQVLSASLSQALPWGENPGGEPLAQGEFVLPVGQSLTLEVELPPDCRLGELLLDTRLDARLGRDSVVRVIIEDITTEQGRSFSSLLRDPHSENIDQWQAGLAEFADALPQISHREPNPSDRDPIPTPYNNTYNLPERNFFHTAVKYHRDDAFLCAHLLPDDAIEPLDAAWADLLTAFDYHDVNVRFVCDKYAITLAPEAQLSLGATWLQAVDEEPRAYIEKFLSEKHALQAARAAAAVLHMQDVLDFASRAWRRPLHTSEVDSLTKFYREQQTTHGLNHPAAVRACITRILVSPDFLFRIESATNQHSSSQLSSTLTAEKKQAALTQYELANRLSFSLWSSIPDQPLRQLADQSRLDDEEVLESQVQRMLVDPKSRRLATEFFGQWLGFYQFDRFNGVDSQRFPEFDEALQQSLYDEAVRLCQHIIQTDLPYQALINADTTFVDQRAAAHYGFTWQADWPATQQRQILKAQSLQRGGVLGLGAILTSTSAPLRTSPVKRGDWILRRLLGTPVPPPPADAGSIPAEEVLDDGQTVRQRLEAHRQHTACMNCHRRIDPLGFTLENYDPLGRWRETYTDGQPIDASGQVSPENQITGLAGLQSYLLQADALVRRNFAGRLVAYFLGRSETVADAALIEQIMHKWQADPRFSTAIVTIVHSPQFRKMRTVEP
jgi:hypothetical protein